MRKEWLLGLLLAPLPVWAQETPSPEPTQYLILGTPSISPQERMIAHWSMVAVPWGRWFKADPFDVIVTDKTSYVHFMWDAQDFKANFEVKDKALRLAEAALQLVSRLYPDKAQVDSVKVDIVYVLEKDIYGRPQWDNLQQVAHFEFLRSEALPLAKASEEPSLTALQKIFSKVEIY